jgi:signal transduction histidine kinase
MTWDHVMSSSISVLSVEDSEDDMSLVVRELRRADFEPVHRRCESADGFLSLLDAGGWDVVIADYAMPRFSGMEALRLLRERDRELPFILVSGTVGEEIAVQSIKAGATDYLMKDNLIRLGPAVATALRDYRERRRLREAESELHRNRGVLDLILANVLDGILLLRRDGDRWTSQTGNSAFHRLIDRLGLKHADPGADAVSLFQDSLGLTRDVVQSLLSRMGIGAELDSTEFAGPNASGLPMTNDSDAPLQLETVVRGPAARIDVEIILQPVAGSREFSLLSVRDITARRRADEERKRYEERLNRSRTLESLGTMAGGIAHDFNNILTCIQGYAELITLDTSISTRVRDQVDEIHRAALRAGELTRQILTFSRRQGVRRQPIPLDRIIAEALRMLRSAIPLSIEVESALPAGLPRILADPVQIHQLVTNLCLNAVQAMESGGGRLSVRLEPTVPAPVEIESRHLAGNSYVRLTIADTGKGIPADLQDRMFEPFFTTRPNGTGLGLAVVHGIVAAHEASIRVRSKVGRGTSFDILFPVTDLDEEESAEEVEQFPLGAGQRILFIDDEQMLLPLAAAMLQRLNYVAETCSDPMLAVDMIRDRPGEFAAILTDFDMPGWNGIEVALRVAELDETLPVVLMTGVTDSVSGRTGAFGFHDVVQKPVSLRELARVMRRALAGPGSKPPSRSD